PAAGVGVRAVAEALPGGVERLGCHRFGSLERFEVGDLGRAVGARGGVSEDLLVRGATRAGTLGGDRQIELLRGGMWPGRTGRNLRFGHVTPARCWRSRLRAFQI